MMKWFSDAASVLTGFLTKHLFWIAPLVFCGMLAHARWRGHQAPAIPSFTVPLKIACALNGIAFFLAVYLLWWSGWLTHWEWLDPSSLAFWFIVFELFNLFSLIYFCAMHSGFGRSLVLDCVAIHALIGIVVWLNLYGLRFAKFSYL